MKLKDRLVGAIPSPDYMKLWLGQAVSWIGDSLGYMALNVMLLQRTGSALVLSFGAVISWLPIVLLGPLAGVLVDRFSRRSVMIVADLARGVITLGVAFMIARGYTATIYAYAWMLLLSVFRVPYTPATMAIIPSLVKPDQLQRANSLQSMAQSIAGIAGPALAGIAIAAFGAPIALTLDAVSFFVSATLITLVRPHGEPQPSQQRRQPVMRQFGEGLKFFSATPLAVLVLISTIVINAANQAAGGAQQVHVLKTLAASPRLYGLIGSAGATAALLSSLVLYSRKKWPTLGRILLIGTAWIGVSIVAFALPTRAEWLPIVAVLLYVIGPFIGMAVSTIYQEITPAEMRGRVFAVRTTLASVLTPVVTLASGWAVDTVGTRAVMLTVGALTVVAAGALALTKVARTSPYFRGEPKEEVSAAA